MGQGNRKGKQIVDTDAEFQQSFHSLTLFQKSKTFDALPVEGE